VLRTVFFPFFWRQIFYFFCVEFVEHVEKAVAPVKTVLHLLQALSKPLQARQRLRAARAEGTGDDPLLN